MAWPGSRASSFPASPITSPRAATNAYAWWDGAVQSTVTHEPDVSESTTWDSTYHYGPSGQLNSVDIDDGRDRTVTYTNNRLGQIIGRGEADGNTIAPRPQRHRCWWRRRQEQSE